MIYGKFIEATGEDTKELLFLARAVLKYYEGSNGTCVTAALKYIYLEKGEYEGDLLGVATDGRQLHLVPLSAKLVERLGLHEGYWRVLKKKKETVWLVNIDEPEAGEFPNFRKVIPSSDEAKYRTTFEGLDSSNYGSYNTKLAKFLHALPDVTAINLNYLRKLGGGKWEVYWYEQCKAIKFTQNDLVVLIMPLHIDNSIE